MAVRDVNSVLFKKKTLSSIRLLVVVDYSQYFSPSNIRYSEKCQSKWKRVPEQREL